jgi:predicted nucleic acid-binding protein
VAHLLKTARKLPGHVFWPDEISLLDHPSIDCDLLDSHDQITDIYLLALAASHGGRLATFDRSIRTESVKGGDSALFVIQKDGATA